MSEDSNLHQPTETERTEILWDTWGVPHIFAKDIESLFHAFGWAQMQSHGDLILRLYGQARGRAGEYWGEEYLESDRWVRTMGIPARARKWYEAQSPTFRSYLKAFADGINAYVREHPDQIDDEVKVILPVDAVDVLAHTQRVIHFTFVVDARRVANINDAWRSAGSNGWAIAPARSAGGKAMLLANPHLPWSDLFLFYEAQLTAPEVNAYGATLVGFAGLGVVFNDYLGWTHTVNTIKGWDAYELTLADGGYRWDGEVRAFETEEHTLKVKQDDGTLREEQLIVRRSIHGPVVAEKDDKMIALRIAGLDQPGMLEQWWDMARATNLTEFEAALKRLQIPIFTVIYADRDGHIMHLFGGRTPVRPKGEWDWWDIVPGDTSATLWTKTHAYEELPRVIDPPSGWLQNANDPPWTTTFPSVLSPDDFPPYMAPRFMHFRAQRSAKMLIEDKRISFEKLVEYKHSTRMEIADHLLDDLITAARHHGGEIAHRSAEVLSAWDRNVDADSCGAVLFEAFINEMIYRWEDSKRKRTSEEINPWGTFSIYNPWDIFATPWSEDSPLTAPSGLSDPAIAVAALEAAAAEVEADYGTLDVAWGEIHRLHRGEIDLPASGGSDPLGIFRAIGFEEASDCFQAIGGDSFIAVVEFSDPVRAMVLTAYGNASQPGSPHFSDQLELFARKELRLAWRTRKEIEDHLAWRKIF